MAKSTDFAYPFGLCPFDKLCKRTKIELMKEGGLGPAAFGPLYVVLFASVLIISFFIGKYQLSRSPEYNPPQVIGASDVVASDSFQVTNIKAGVLDAGKVGCVRGVFDFWGEITVSGAGTVLYDWEGAGNASMSTPLTYEAAGTKKVSTSWSVWRPGARSIRLHVFSPNNIFSSEIEFELYCE